MLVTVTATLGRGQTFGEDTVVDVAVETGGPWMLFPGDGSPQVTIPAGGSEGSDAFVIVSLDTPRSAAERWWR